MNKQFKLYSPVINEEPYYGTKSAEMEEDTQGEYYLTSEVDEYFKGLPRTETGVVQHSGDWPGIFIRGDNALALSVYLDNILDQIETGNQDQIDTVSLYILRGHAQLLKSCLVK